MKKVNLLLVVIGLFSLLGANAQVTVTDSKTIKLGTTNNIVSTDYKANFGDAAGVEFNSSDDPGTLIESGNIEGAGVYMDGDKIVMWSPGDDNIVNFCDEDLMNGAGSNFHDAVVSFVDGEGYYYQVSDSTHKEQITNIKSSLSKMMQLRGVEYFHKKNSKKAAKENEKNSNFIEVREKKSGFLAQEVEKILPEAVATNKAGVKFVNYQAMIPFLVEAMREQQTQIEQLKKENETMKNDIAQIKKSLKLDIVK